ncbi:uncharacterized protein MONBRDRAFT_33736 [Monosiga brevicollis MX1]|uniref:SH2 domain-containing protein n=1 Tax=Monosiga brevicollis TaxID=81824 RepID=A9V765_MONBE|nr:uncharacterized protein MONBRDRAFT_33736 [Monosiga brevicollis MX1]EDQ86666.1 predicted protein [Monosiga brevicollis MX1]|eukprot:XP_001748502.1 hypothetical protein [Monosiga brevicollis MX1]
MAAYECIHYTKDVDARFAGTAFTAGLGRRAANALVREGGEGTYLVRYNETHDFFVLTVCLDGRAEQFRIHVGNDDLLTLDFHDWQPSIDQLVAEATHRGFIVEQRRIHLGRPVETMRLSFYRRAIWFDEHIERDDALHALAQQPEGTFVVRCNRRGGLSLTLALAPGQAPINYVIHRTFEGYTVADELPQPTLMHLIEDIVKRGYLTTPDGYQLPITQPLRLARTARAAAASTGRVRDSRALPAPHRHRSRDDRASQLEMADVSRSLRGRGRRNVESQRHPRAYERASTYHPDSGSEDEPRAWSRTSDQHRGYDRDDQRRTGGSAPGRHHGRRTHHSGAYAHDDVSSHDYDDYDYDDRVNHDDHKRHSKPRARPFSTHQPDASDSRRRPSQDARPSLSDSFQPSIADTYISIQPPVPMAGGHFRPSVTSPVIPPTEPSDHFREPDLPEPGYTLASDLHGAYRREAADSYTDDEANASGSSADEASDLTEQPLPPADDYDDYALVARNTTTATAARVGPATAAVEPVQPVGASRTGTTTTAAAAPEQVLIAQRRMSEAANKLPLDRNPTFAEKQRMLMDVADLDRPGDQDDDDDDDLGSEAAGGAASVVLAAVQAEDPPQSGASLPKTYIPVVQQAFFGSSAANPVFPSSRWGGLKRLPLTANREEVNENYQIRETVVDRVEFWLIIQLGLEMLQMMALVLYVGYDVLPRAFRIYTFDILQVLIMQLSGFRSGIYQQFVAGTCMAIVIAITYSYLFWSRQVNKRWRLLAFSTLIVLALPMTLWAAQVAVWGPPLQAHHPLHRRSEASDLGADFFFSVATDALLAGLPCYRDAEDLPTVLIYLVAALGGGILLLVLPFSLHERISQGVRKLELDFWRRRRLEEEFGRSPLEEQLQRDGLNGEASQRNSQVLDHRFSPSPPPQGGASPALNSKRGPSSRPSRAVSPDFLQSSPQIKGPGDSRGPSPALRTNARRASLLMPLDTPAALLLQEMKVVRVQSKLDWERRLRSDEGLWLPFYDGLRYQRSYYHVEILALKFFVVAVTVLLEPYNSCLGIAEREPFAYARDGAILAAALAVLCTYRWRSYFLKSRLCGLVATLQLLILVRRVVRGDAEGWAYGFHALCLLIVLVYIGAVFTTRYIQQKRNRNLPNMLDPAYDPWQCIRKQMWEPTWDLLFSGMLILAQFRAHGDSASPCVEPQFRPPADAHPVFYRLAKGAPDMMQPTPDANPEAPFTVGERHYENKHICRRLGPNNFRRALLGHRGSRFKLQREIAQFLGPDAWHEGTGQFGTLHAAPFPFTLVFRSDSNGHRRVLPRDFGPMLDFVRTNSSTDIQALRKARRQLRALDGQRVALAKRRITKTVNIQFDHGEFRLKFIDANDLWLPEVDGIAPMNVGPGFSLMLVLEDGYGIDDSRREHHVKQHVLTEVDFDLTAGFSVTSKLAELFAQNDALLAQRMPLIEASLLGYNQHLQHELWSHDETLSYRFHAEVYLSPGSNWAQVEETIRFEKNTAIQAVVEHPVIMGLRDRVEFLRRHPACCAWALFWHHIWELRGRDPEYQRLAQFYNPDFGASLAWRPMRREHLARKLDTDLLLSEGEIEYLYAMIEQVCTGKLPQYKLEPPKFNS